MSMDHDIFQQLFSSLQQLSKDIRQFGTRKHDQFRVPKFNVCQRVSMKDSQSRKVLLRQTKVSQGDVKGKGSAD
ncbi:hypothetical protein M0802_004754 [Mischocyttarus mexicanus]|nr:hypothetical protein M0802_004754 [Mischocyttarus mexicanus]